MDALEHVYRPGFKYSNAGVMQFNFYQSGEYTDDLFTVLDKINGRWGRGTLRAASVPSNPNWGMRREMMSQSFTTRLDQLWTVECR